MYNSALVSIVVISYNSSLTILETLDSVKNQTYYNIELIISDDCSKDNTVEVCRRWINENKERFVEVSVVTSNQNTGTTGNCNRGCRKANGEWVKLIAADDILLPNCINDNVDYCLKDPEISILFAEIIPFVRTKNGVKKKEKTEYHKLDFWDKPAYEQYAELLYCNFIPAPTSFIKRKLLIENPYDEKYPFMEDYPQWLQLTRNGVKLFSMNKATILYRVGDSISHSTNRFFSPRYRDSYCKFFWNVLNPAIIEVGDINAYNYQRKILFMYDLMSFVFHNRLNKVSSLILKLVAGVLKKFNKINFQQ